MTRFPGLLIAGSRNGTLGSDVTEALDMKSGPMPARFRACDFSIQGQGAVASVVDSTRGAHQETDLCSAV